MESHWRGFFERLGHLGQVMAGEDAQHQGNAQEDENGLEHIPQGNHQGRNGSRHAGAMQVKGSPSPEVERGEDDGHGGGNGCETDG